MRRGSLRVKIYEALGKLTGRGASRTAVEEEYGRYQAEVYSPRLFTQGPPSYRRKTPIGRYDVLRDSECQSHMKPEELYK